jgi:hypothetical protein
MATPSKSLQHTHRPPLAPLNTRAAGVVILLSAILSIVFVALDPMVSGTDALSIMQSMIKDQAMHQLVHIVEMACITGFMFGYTVLSQRLGLQRIPVIVGLISYGLGTVLMLLGTVLDGFVSGDTAAMFVGGSPEAVKVGYWIIGTLSGVVLTDVARVAWVFQSIAAVSWAFALLPERGFRRVIGVIGLLAGALPAAAVVIAGSNMNATVVVGILMVQAVWNLAAAVLLLHSSRAVSDASAREAVAAY